MIETRVIDSAHVKAHTFPMGRIEITNRIAQEIQDHDLFSALDRYARGDWGNVTEEERMNNVLASSTDHPARVTGVYETFDGMEFWIITERLRTVTVVLMPGDYPGLF